MYTVGLATWLALAINSSYVLVLHIKIPAYLKNRDRNDPEVMKHRMKRITLLCVSLVALIPALLVHWGAYRSYFLVLHNMGLAPGLTLCRNLRFDAINILRSLGYLLVLYSGSIALYTTKHKSRLSVVVKHKLFEAFALLQGFRDHIFAPVSEELLYRSLTICVLAPVLPESRIILMTPLLFGCAHLHHALFLWKNSTNASISVIALTTLFQLFYTSVFALMSNRFFLKYGHNIACSICLHCVCNLFGIPPLSIEGSLSWRILYAVLTFLGLYIYFFFGLC